ncbi:Transcriptional regulator containing PAS, AAA-type ATPase, and DNA-binding Fis domains [Gracilibacillus ureilyticus]|uniref:Transcriptional regulator containing PAS, AAA-type ATPase, and DNA-binding Fis domains n=1 Tax=Gracilibacillus ureilyticus TaxID=531814 RepID=A0A1H9LVQ2_9BACI|nr:Transcriptional regulator containing PAS, AAA-type ATPase, and DNA-binding Fis domains [Gracilibacillus ureilyticus]
MKLSAKNKQIITNFNEKFINNFPFGLLILDDRKQIVHANNYAVSCLAADENGTLEGKFLAEFFSENMVDEVWQKREVLNRIEKLRANGQDVFCTYSPILDDKGLTISTMVTFQEYDLFIENVQEQTGHYPLTEVIPLIVEYSPDAVSFVFSNQEETYFNNKWEQLVKRLCDEGDDSILSELDNVLAQIVEETIKQRRKIIKVVTIGNDLEIEVTSKPVIISGKLYGCFQMIKDFKELNKYRRKYNMATSVIRNLEKTYLFDDIIGDSFELTMAKKQAKFYANMNVPIFLRGEQGTGKELIARTLHFDSNRKEYPFKLLRAAEWDEESLKNFIFAENGILKEVKKGTLFIDECTLVPANLLDRMAEEMAEYNSPESFQLIVSTSMLNEELPRSLFYEWISRYQLELPPLRNRKQDILPLAHQFMNQNNMKYKTQLEEVSEDVVDLFEQYDWSKNISELENVMEHAATKASTAQTVLNKELLPDYFLNIMERKTPAYTEGMELQLAIDLFEKNYIENTLIGNNYNKTKTAKQLGISIRNLYYKMDKYNIDRGGT